MDSQQSEAGMEVVRLLLAFHQLEKQLAAASGLSVDEFHCLALLHVHVPCCVKDVSEILGVAPSRASRLLHSLEARGYLVRSLGYSDKRKELLALTDEGMAAADDLFRLAARSLPDLLSSLPAEMSGVLHRSLS